VRRLFSTFAHGRPGLALLLLRLTAGVVLIARAISLLGHERPADTVLAMIAVVTGLLLIAGLWTIVAGPVAALAGVWHGLPQPSEPLANVLWAAMAVALALIGPGAYSCDARLFGWQRIDVRDRSR
jgi:hypothetical protein